MPKARQNYNIYVLKPNLVLEWHPSRNGNLRPRDVTPGSAKKVWWICEEGHEWQAAIYSRSRGSGCPKCYKANSINHDAQMVSDAELIMEWHPTKNGYLRLEDVTTGLDQQVWWICKEGHEWQATAKSRRKGSGCPRCNRAAGQKKSSINKTGGNSINFIAKRESRLSTKGAIIGPAISDMISDTDFRKDERFQFQDTIILEMSDSGQWCYARSVNIGGVGMFFESEFPFKAGTEIIVQFNHSPFKSSQKTYPSIVRWCKELAYDSTASSYGVGVEFIEKRAITRY